ncbi:ubiquinol-cytochrome-c reductase complex assembly factor 4, partial [Boleophthalmus pectinirostris]|uniref:ubiquinol-cytochrome-c reductase complex assembly factor 4 n=1 Tax=Boleophthalmus pectinirostris TaxID=150288 RepID=UPI00242EFE21
FQYNTTTVRLSSVRPLALSSQLETGSKKTSDEQTDEPIKFSTSKASHRTWKVDRSMGSQFSRPWRKVLPISIFFSVFLLWCVLRGHSDVDTQLDRPLYESLPSLQPEDDGPDKKPS